MKDIDIRLTSHDYWTDGYAKDVSGFIQTYMKNENKTEEDIMKLINVTKDEFNAIIERKHEFSLRKFIEIFMACGYVVKVDLIPKNRYYLDNK